MKSFSMSKIRSRIKNMKKTDWLILILVGVLVLIIAVPTNTGSRDKEKESDVQLAVAENQAAVQQAQALGGFVSAKTDSSEYVHALEQELEELLGTVSGVGKVKVMITLQNMGEDILDKNMDSDENGYSSATVLYDCGDYEAPYVIRKDTPQIQGVVVVCEGGSDSIVISKISDVIMSLFPIEMHKITVVKMSASEGTN